ncbi:MAG: response regulator [Endomicrobia bacterium]|nr:response regulator [Endomicrobiia bacterium]MCX7940836.1 response regulator [Endomicrobiia bacterium]MDW8055518.1 response regulator [Elusimicrobiota bacterium]
MRIIVIDDDKEILDLLETFFSTLGHQTDVFTNSIEGLRSIAKEVYDLVLLDIKLPERDGIEVLKEIKSVDTNLPVVMITGYKEAEKVIEAFRNGAMDCLLKPFNFDYIKNNILTRISERKK